MPPPRPKDEKVDPIQGRVKGVFKFTYQFSRMNEISDDGIYPAVLNRNLTV